MSTMVNDAGSLRYEKLIEVVNSLYENGPGIDGRHQRPTPILDRSYAHTHVSLCYDYVLIALYRHMCIARRCRLLYLIYTYIFLRAFSALLLLPLPALFRHRLLSLMGTARWRPRCDGHTMTERQR